MKKPLAAIAALSAIFAMAGIASAEPPDFTACTTDGHTATLHADITGTVADGNLKQIISDAFTKTATAMTKDDLLEKGYPVFLGNIRDEIGDRQVSPGAKMDVLGAPEFGPAGSCAP